MTGGGTPHERAVAWGDELVKLHDTFRRDLAELRDGTVPALDLREHCLTFCDALHAHHTGEDDVLFPHVGGLHPELSATLDRLRAEHHVIGRLIARIRSLAEAGRPVESGAPEVAAELDRLTRELEAHLDYEEEQLVPLLNGMTDMPENL